MYISIWKLIQIPNIQIPIQIYVWKLIQIPVNDKRRLVCKTFILDFKTYLHVISMMMIAPNSRARKGGKERGEYGGIWGEEEENAEEVYRL